MLATAQLLAVPPQAVLLLPRLLLRLLPLAMLTPVPVHKVSKVRDVKEVGTEMVPRRATTVQVTMLVKDPTLATFKHLRP